MALVVVASFLDLTEANIAAGALRAAGLHPEVADQHAGTAMAIQQLALQGFRLSVPEDEIADARAIIAEAQARSRPRRHPQERPGANLWRLLALVLMFFMGPALGWLAVLGLRPRRSYDHVPFVLALTAAVIAAVFCLDMAVRGWPQVGPLVGLLAIGVAVAAVGRFMRSAVEKEDAEPSPQPHTGLDDE